MSNLEKHNILHHLTVKMTSALVVEMLVKNISPSQDSGQPDNDFQSRFIITEL